MKYDPTELVAKYNKMFPQDPWPLGLEQLVRFINSDTELKQDQRWVAYLLATIKWESLHKFLPIREIGRGVGKKYGEKYYGRGYVQLTWEENYKNFGAVLELDLVNNPDLALQANISYQIASLGMQRGLFTGRKLSDYFNKDKEEWRKARYIINGQDKAMVIGQYGEKFRTILSNSIMIFKPDSKVPSIRV